MKRKKWKPGCVIIKNETKIIRFPEAEHYIQDIEIVKFVYLRRIDLKI